MEKREDSFVIIDNDEMSEPKANVYDMKSTIKVSNEYDGFNMDDFIAVDDSPQVVKQPINSYQSSEVEQVKPITTVKVDTSNDKSSSSSSSLSATGKNVVQEFLEKHVQPIQEGIQKGIQTQMDDHLKPSIKEAGKKFQAGVNEHVVSKVGKVGRGLFSLRSNATSTIEKLGQNTKGAFDEHVVPKIQVVQAGTSQTFENVKRSTEVGLDVTRNILGEIPTHTSNAWDMITEIPKKYAEYYWNTAPSIFRENDPRTVIVILEAILMSFGQVIFCPNPISGGLIFLAMLAGVPLVALSALSCVVSSNFLMHYLDFDLNDIKKGYYGANPVLVGAGCAAYLRHGSIVLRILYAMIFSPVVLAPITLMIHHNFVLRWLPKGQPVLLMVYNVVMIVVLSGASLSNEALLTEPVYYSADEAGTFSLFSSFFRSILNGLSAIFLVPGHWYSGLIILIAATLCSRIIALSLLTGSLIGSILGMIFGVSFWTIDAGISGYDAALTAAAFAYYLEPTWRSCKVILPAVLWACMLEAAVGGLLNRIFGTSITLTIAFCLSTVSFLMLDLQRIFGLKRIPTEELTTPEEYLLKMETLLEDDDLCDVDFAEVDEKYKMSPPQTESLDEKVVANEETPLFVV